ncbi:SCO1664 family protein [Janibacter sp. GXQ6167]|uniref:SCO1664 family protein n=1 Tax=Janibacter sp. GXQ6167 TaxID=3240791 RepID=UPI0035240438
MDADATRVLLRTGHISVLGGLPDSSNHAALVRVTAAPDEVFAVYKPIAGERPLWDFPDGTLAGREIACALIDEAGGWGIVPPTVLRDGPLGPGALQQWIGEPPRVSPSPVTVTTADEVPKGWWVVLEGEGEGGEPLVLAHADTAVLRSIAVLDAVLNNSDRKGGHLLDWHDHTWGIDHGVSLHEEPKLRTVLWGWAGRPLVEGDITRLQALAGALDDESLVAQLQPHLTSTEIDALTERVERLLATRRHPMPSPGWPAIPWPAM